MTTTLALNREIIAEILDSMREEEGVGKDFLPAWRDAREWLCSALAADRASRWQRHCLLRGFGLIESANPYHAESGVRGKAQNSVRGIYNLRLYLKGVDPVCNLQNGLIKRYGMDAIGKYSHVS